MFLSTETQGNAEGFTQKDEPDVTTMDDVNMEEPDEEQNEEGNEVSDEDSPWTPEELDQAYTKEGDDDDSQKITKPR